MEQKIAQFISTRELIDSKDKLLLAVSGGVDSVVMAHLMASLKHSFGIAHVNYQLRGEDSDRDQELVEKLALDLGVTCHIKKFDTLKYAETSHTSIQMAARELRYQWFEEILSSTSYTKVATAHHQNDVVETMILNLTKGTGIRGLHGIAPKRGSVIRPLLFATKEEIERYAKALKINWRQDDSNNQDYYQRNLIRNQVIPVLKQINSNLEFAFTNTGQIMEEIEGVLTEKAHAVGQKACSKQGDNVHIQLPLIMAEPNAIWFELLREFGFNMDQINAIRDSTENANGQIFYAAGFRLNVDRAQLIISPLESIKGGGFSITTSKQHSWSYHKRTWSLKTAARTSYQISKKTTTGAWDLNLLQFPLQVRAWEAGDWFYPLGMSHKKKLSDFFIDMKVPLNIKHQTPVVVSGDAIVWVVGFRIDDRFKITPGTETVLEIEVQ